MNKKSFYTLEYNKILSALSEHANTTAGKNLCLNLMPMDRLFSIEHAQSETEDALNRLLRDSSISFNASELINESLGRLDKGSSLSVTELINIASLLENALRCKSYGQTDTECEDSLTDYFTALTPLSPLKYEINRCIISADEIADDASSTLHDIRRKIKATGDRIHTQLSKMVNDTYRSYLQENIITMRDDRYCIPVKSEYKGNVPGMIHDQSQSASTFFIEPAAIVTLNNELKQLSIEEAKEIEIILAKLSSKCLEHIEELKANYKILTTLDFIFAKGSYALSEGSTRPLYNSDKIIRLKKARHPLLDKKTAVPINVTLGDEYNLLVVTGPNTGGKTVSLKTVGLLTLMGQAGLHIPAADKSELSIFTNVYADIGDEQSIEQNLSTFSSHMKTIVEILKGADSDSLCLFDELGAGTDPTEGAALAIAILSTLHDRGIRTMATTHYSELKIYALNTEGVENAGCEFDVDSLKPTYRLITGIPGKSNAFSISKRLGLDEKIIERARNEISANDSSFEDVIQKLNKDRSATEAEKLKIKALRQDIESLKESYSQKEAKLTKSRENILEEAKEEARRILAEAKEQADDAIRAINRHQSSDINSLEEKRRALKKGIDKNKPKATIAITPTAPTHKSSDFKIGTDVRIISMDLTGHVHTLPDSKGNLSVGCGIMNINTNIRDLEIIMSKEDTGFNKPSKTFKGNKTSSLSKASNISSEINLIGLKVDEAIPKLDKYLDDAYLSHLTSVRIVHGKGTGALRSAVTGYLKKISYVESFRAGEFGEGDAGVTIVTFK